MSNRHQAYKSSLDYTESATILALKSVVSNFLARSSILVLISALAALLPINQVLAQGQFDPTITVNSRNDDLPQPISLTVTPATAYLKVGPGNTALHSITLTNDGERSIKVSPKLVSFTTDGLSGQPQLEETSNFPYLDENKTSFQSLSLQPNQTAQLTLHISVPPQAEKAEYPLTVLFVSVPISTSDSQNANQVASPQTESTTKLAGTIGSNLIVLITSEKEPAPQLRVADWQSWPIVDSFGEITVRPIIQNDSYAAGVASGSATITNWRGQQVATFQIEPTVILGESSRLIVPTREEAGDGQAETSANQAPAFTYTSPFLIGPYTIEVTLVTNQANGASANISETTIIALPISLLLAIVFATTLWWVYSRFQKSRQLF